MSLPPRCISSDAIIDYKAHPHYYHRHCQHDDLTSKKQSSYAVLIFRTSLSHLLIIALLFISLEDAVDFSAGEHPHVDDYAHPIDSGAVIKPGKVGEKKWRIKKRLINSPFQQG